MKRMKSYGGTKVTLLAKSQKSGEEEIKNETVGPNPDALQARRL